MIKKVEKTALVVSLILTIFVLVGASYEKYGNWNGTLSAVSFIQGVVYVVFFYLVILYFYRICDHQVRIKALDEIRRYLENRKPIQVIIQIASVMLLCWMPYLIAYFPGSIQSDATSQIMQYFGLTPMNDHHPAFSTWLIGLCIASGKAFGSINMGLFLYVLLQSVISALIFAYCIYSMNKYEAPVSLAIGTFLYFSCVPFWPAYEQTVIKDTLFTAIVALFVVTLYHLTHNWNYFRNSKKQISLFIILMFVMSLLRKNGIYVAVATLLVMAFMYRRQYKLIVGMLLITLCLFEGYSHILLPMCNVQSGSIKEALSIPFQQTARYLKEYPQDVTEEEREAIDEVLDYATIALQYNPYISDPVKNTFKQEAGKKEIINYFSAWFQMFIKHPGVYVQATIHNSYGYVYPNSRIMGPYGVFEMELGQPLEGMEFHYSFENLESVRTILMKTTYVLGNIPVIHWIYHPATYTWVIFIAVGYCIRKKDKSLLVVLIPSITILLTCVASPVNAYIRYALPMMASVPIVIAAMLEKRKSIP